MASRSCSFGSCGNSSPVCVAVDAAELLDQRGEVVGVEVRVLRAGALALLRAVEGLLEQLAGHVHHDLAEHLDESAVGVPGEPHVAVGLLREPSTERSFSPRFRTVSIIPGIENLAPRPHADQQRVVGIAELPAHRLLEADEVLPRLLEHLRWRPALLQEHQACLGGDREPRRDRQPHVGHLGEVGALAAEEVLHVLVAFGEVVDVLRSCPKSTEWLYGTSPRRCTLASSPHSRRI